MVSFCVQAELSTWKEDHLGNAAKRSSSPASHPHAEQLLRGHCKLCNSAHWGMAAHGHQRTSEIAQRCQHSAPHLKLNEADLIHQCRTDFDWNSCLGFESRCYNAAKVCLEGFHMFQHFLQKSQRPAQVAVKPTAAITKQERARTPPANQAKQPPRSLEPPILGHTWCR